MCDDGNPRSTRNKPGSSNHKICIPFLLNWASPTSGLTDTFKRTSDDLVVHTSPRSHDDILFRPEAGGTEFNDYLPLSLTLDDSLIDFGLGAGVSAPLSPSFHLGMPDQMSLSTLFPVMDRSQDQGPIGGLTEQMDSPYPFNDSVMDRDLSAEFADHLTALTLTLPHNHPEHAPSLNLALGMSTLSSTNISRFLQLYFHHWNRHSPVVHPGTFDVLNAPLPLLFVMTLTGALFSLFPDAVTAARSMLELAEEFAFQDSDFQKVASGIFPEGVDQRCRALQAFQAAFCASQLQLREGNMWKRKCVRTFRFDQIICAVRTMGLHNGDLLPLDVSSQGTGLSDWNRFAENESRLRLLCGIFNLDVAFTVFYGERPRLFYHELHIGMPCSYDVFMAKTSSAYNEAVTYETRTSRHSLPSTVMAFAGNRADLLPENESFNLLYLFSVLFGLMQIIQNYLQCGISEGPRCRLEEGLQLWRTKWDATILQMSPSQLETSGFCKDAGPEFWQLACYLLTTGAGTASSGSEDSSYSTSQGMNIFKELLRSAKSLK